MCDGAEMFSTADRKHQNKDAQLLLIIKESCMLVLLGC